MPESRCPLCRESGIIQGTKGELNWCHCPAADRIRREYPGWLETLVLYQRPARIKMQQNEESAKGQLLHMAGSRDQCPDCDGIEITVVELGTMAIIRNIESALMQTLASKLPMADNLDLDEGMKVVAWAYKVTIALLELRTALITIAP